MRYLVVGLGNIGEKRRRVLADRCVATVDPYRADADWSSHLDVPSGSYDAAVLATPGDVKLDCVSYFLDAGKHVLVEKPLLFPDERAAADLRDLARRSGAIWYTSYNHRFEPHIVAMKELLDGGFVGSVYWARLVYGNGTVRNILGSWRESGFGVLEDLGCHLIDLAELLLGSERRDFTARELRSFEAECFDHCVFSTPGGEVWIECSWTTWKNTFSIDVHGSRGSIHMSGLSKWGPTELITRKRVLPSGVPEETREVLDSPDATWEQDLVEFEERVREGRSSFESDLRISKSLHALAQGVEPVSKRELVG